MNCDRLKFSSVQDFNVRSHPWRYPVKLLAIFGSSEGGLELDQDRVELEQLQQSGAMLTILEQPTREALHNQLCNQTWDILFFAGHSFSEDRCQMGYIQITDERSLSLDDLDEDLRTAISRGLKLAIFNSCDGLGISTYLANLQIPSTIVMKEPVPDVIAREFLRYFLNAFASGKPLSLAVRETRRNLQWWESAENPCPAASWLPIVCQNPTQAELVWSTLPSRFNICNPLLLLLTQISRPYLPPIVFILLVLGLAMVGYLNQAWLWQPPSDSNRTQPVSRFKDVNVPDPEGQEFFRFAGSTASAALLCADGDDPGNGGIHRHFLTAHPQFKLEYIPPETGAPSSGKGLELLMDGKVDFILSSRLPKGREDQQARDRNFELQPIKIAQYATAFSVHQDVGIGAIKGLRFEQLKTIFTSNIPLNWQQFGGVPYRIKPYVHEAEKGAVIYIGKGIFGAFGSTVTYVKTTTQAMQAIASDYGGIYRAPSVLTFGQKTVATMPIINERGEAVLPFTDPTFNPTEACKNLNNDANTPAPINSDYPSDLQEPLYVIFKDYPGNANLQERAGRAYAELLRTDQGARCSMR
ncbi:CHAT domain-containing protein [bacterium]|nr:CHAT domain-containing protein [bacterium]